MHALLIFFAYKYMLVTLCFLIFVACKYQFQFLAIRVYHLGFDFGSYEPRAFLVWNIESLGKLDFSHYLWVDGGFE